MVSHVKYWMTFWAFTSQHAAGVLDELLHHKTAHYEIDNPLPSPLSRTRGSPLVSNTWNMYLVCCSSSHIWWHNHSHFVLSQRLRRVVTWNALADAVYARDRNATVTSFRSNITTFKSASITKEMLMVSLHWDENKILLSGSQFLYFVFQSRSKLQFYFNDDRTPVVTSFLTTEISKIWTKTTQ